MPTRRVRWSIPAVAVLLAVTACGGDDPAAPAAPPATAAPPPATSAPPSAATPSAATPTPTAAVDKEIVVTVAKKKVTPPTGRVEVGLGSTVRITVTSDVADELHVHGFDLTMALTAGQPASIEFRADRTGLFEVETHTAHLVLVQLVVR